MFKLIAFNACVMLLVLGVWCFASKRKHLLSTLLSLEFIALTLYRVLVFYLVDTGSEFYMTMVFLTMAVCEGALGLSVLVSIIRTHGNDYFQTFSVLQC